MKWACALFVTLVLSACVSSNDFTRMRSDLYELQRSHHDTRKEIDSLKEKTAGVVKEDSFAAIKESHADLFAKVNTTSNGLQELRGRFDENRYFTEKSIKEFSTDREFLKVQITGLDAQFKVLKDKVAALDSQLRALEQVKEPSASSSSPADSGEKSPTAAGGASAEAAPDNKTEAYDKAYQLFKDRKFREARERFEAFIRSYPKTDLTDNAQFWIAETYYNEKDFESAILSYETLIKKYPDSDKVGGGMLKQGLAFVEIGDAKTGKIIFNKLVEKYPDSKDAEVAKKKIADLDTKPQKKR